MLNSETRGKRNVMEQASSFWIYIQRKSPWIEETVLLKFESVHRPLGSQMVAAFLQKQQTTTNQKIHTLSGLRLSKSTERRWMHSLNDFNSRECM